MPAGTWSPAPALLQLRDEIDAWQPDRRRSTDGFIGNADHHMIADPVTGDRRRVREGERPSGEHVPTDEFGRYRAGGVVRAADYDVRLPDGTEFGDELVQRLIADGKRNDRLAYVIYEGTIWSRNSRWEPRRSSGHGHWVHASIRNEVSSGGSTVPADVIAAAADTSPWFDNEEIDMEWPSCIPVKKNSRWVVDTPAGMKARTAPLIDPSTEMHRNGKLVTVAKGYPVRVEACAFVGGLWWIRGGTYWYALTREDGSLYFKKAG